MVSLVPWPPEKRERTYITQAIMPGMHTSVLTFTAGPVFISLVF